MYACDGGSYRIVKLLLDKGADPNDAAKVHKITHNRSITSLIFLE